MFRNVAAGKTLTLHFVVRDTRGGRTVKLTARSFDSRGRFLREEKGCANVQVESRIPVFECQCLHLSAGHEGSRIDKDVKDIEISHKGLDL